MAIIVRKTTECAETGLLAEWALANGGSIELYDGTMPATAATAIGVQALIATFTLPSPAVVAGSAGDGVINLGTVTNATAVATKTASWARVKKSGGATVMDVNVGTSGAFLTIDNTSITTGDTLTLTGTSITATLT